MQISVLFSCLPVTGDSTDALFIAHISRFSQDASFGRITCLACFLSAFLFLSSYNSGAQRFPCPSRRSPFVPGATSDPLTVAAHLPSVSPLPSHSNSGCFPFPSQCSPFSVHGNCVAGGAFAPCMPSPQTRRGPTP